MENNLPKVLYQVNRTYISNEQEELVLKQEIIDNITLRLRQKNIAALLGGIHPLFFFIGIIFMLAFLLGGGLLLLLMGIGATYALIVTSNFLLIPISAVIMLLGIAVIYLYAKPIFMSGFETVRYLIACSSAERLYLYLKKTHRLEVAVVTLVKRNGDSKVIEYQHILSTNEAINDFYITRSDTNIYVGDRIYILFSAGIRILL